MDTLSRKVALKNPDIPIIFATIFVALIRVLHWSRRATQMQEQYLYNFDEFLHFFQNIFPELWIVPQSQVV